MSGIINKRENNQTNKQKMSGNSLAVQWLGLHAFSALVQVQSLVGKLQSCKLHGLTKKKKKKRSVGMSEVQSQGETNSAQQESFRDRCQGCRPGPGKAGRSEPRNPAWWVALEQRGEGPPQGVPQRGPPWPQPSPPAGPGGATHHQLRRCRLFPAPGLQQRLHLLCG